MSSGIRAVNTWDDSTTQRSMPSIRRKRATHLPRKDPQRRRARAVRSFEGGFTSPLGVRHPDVCPPLAGTTSADLDERGSRGEAARQQALPLPEARGRAQHLGGGEPEDPFQLAQVTW